MFDVPTLRLSTLRRLLAGMPSPLVFDRATPQHVVDEALRDVPRAKVVFVDSEVFAGIRVAGDPAVHTDAVFLAPEEDVEGALATLESHHAGYVVAALSGQLVGVLTRDELVAAMKRRVA
ncbi:MAG: hypothetical protein QM831_13145 [Kofleriaceae bacterium]